MPSIAQLCSIGMAPQEAKFLGEDFDLSISATGNNSQANGYVITKSVNYFTTVTAGAADSAKLPLAIDWGRGFIFVCNDGAGTLNLFPGVGDNINNGAANARIQVPSGSRVFLIAVTSTMWVWF